jgi:hypothetical protein
MRSPSSTTASEPPPGRSALVLGVVSAALLAGCAAEPLSNGTPPPQEQPTEQPVYAQDAKAPVLGLEYVNKSTRATLQLDMGSEDIQAVMTGSPARRDSARAVAGAPTPQPSSVQVVQAPAAAAPQSMSEDSLLARARRIVDSAVRATEQSRPRDAAGKASRAAVPDSVTRQVVAEIRKAQESFYKARYQEAAEHAARSIAIHPTPEGYALAGSICWTLKDKDGARKQWLLARDLDPDFPGLAAMLDSQEAAP